MKLIQVAVLGVLERIGICVAKDLTKSPFKAVTQVSNYTPNTSNRCMDNYWVDL